MSGHSKWHKIQHKKGKNDAARGKIFTKLCKAITIAAQNGGDPNMNFSLRLAIEKAKAENVPKDNIERAIKRGTGEDKEGVQFHEVTYEGYGPGGIAIIVECITDNTNRSVSDVKHAFSKHGGSMGNEGSVRWQFERLGVVMFNTEKKETIDDRGSFELSLIDAGADDIKVTDDGVEVRCKMEDFAKVLGVVEGKGIEPDDSGLQWVAKEEVPVDDKTSDKMQTLYEALDELDDVNDVYTNEA